ncbi:anti-sigma factor family protein [Gimesia sp.]|uniref:anti-sigma factor n=1 Tax=Gimesia sp. TaxID=2024833 RepID=UPI003A90DD54
MSQKPNPENTQNNAQEIISAFLDGILTEEENQRFLKRLETDETARELYLEMMNTDSLLQWEQGQTEPLPELFCLTPERDTVTSSVDPGVVSARKQLTVMRYALATTVVACLFLTVLLLMDSTPARAVTRLDSSDGVPAAMIIEEHQADWERTEWTQDVSKPLVPGWLKLKSGRALIDFLSGTTVALEGPAELGINSDNRAYLKTGRLAVVGSARHHEFTLTTAKLTLLSESASFGLSVNDDEQTELHVFSGSVSITQSQEKPDSNMKQDQTPETTDELVVSAGQSILFDSAGQEVSRQLADQSLFPTRDQFAVADPPGDIPALNFAAHKIEPYSFQDGQYELPTHYQLIEQGKGIRLWGNAWKTLEVNTEITPNTVIEFDFRSLHEGQIHGFGFDKDKTYNKGNQVFQIYGYEAWSHIGQQFNTYTGTGWKRFRIRVGRYLTGNYRYLHFIADEDVIARAESQFRNVRIYEAPTKQ